jgi:uncharacterized membrane protein YfcA
MTLAQSLWAVAGGAGTGLMMSLVGGGGSALAVPVMTGLVHVNPFRLAVGTTAAAVAVTAAANGWAYWRRRAIEWSFVAALSASAVVGLAVGLHLQSRLPARFLLAGLGGLLLINAAIVLRVEHSPSQAARVGNSQRPQPALPRHARLIATGLCAGILAGMLGIGGGFLIFPSLLVQGLPLSMAAGSSAVTVGVLGAVTALSYAVRGLIDWTVALAYVMGGILGTLLAVPIVRAVGHHRRTMAYLVAFVFVSVALVLVISNLFPIYIPPGLL